MSVLKRLERYIDRHGLVQPTAGTTSQNGVRWTSDVINFIEPNRHLFTAILLCRDPRGFYTRHPATQEPCLIDDYQALAFACYTMGNLKEPKEWLKDCFKSWGFMGRNDLQHQMLRHPGLIVAMRKAAGIDTLFDSFIANAALRVAAFQLKRKDSPDGWALSYYLAIMFDAQWFIEKFRKRYPNGYGQLLYEWGGDWKSHPTTKMLLGDIE